MTKFTFFVSLLFVTNFLGAAEARDNSVKPPHLDLEMSGREYSELLNRMTLNGAFLTDDHIQEILDVGKRNLDWLQHINQFRDASRKISFSSPKTQPGIPIDNPRKYNPEIIWNQYQDLLKVLPVEMKDVLVAGKSFTNDTPIPEADYIEWGRKVNASYDIAARWTLMVPFLPYLEGQKANDVRGYYFLNKEPDLANKLRDWKNLDSKVRAQLTEWLLEICGNSDLSDQQCESSLQTTIKQNKVSDYYARFFPHAAEVWAGFFSLGAERSDITWTGQNPKLTEIPFVNPGKQDVVNFLGNIEDEWKWNGWQLKLDFKPQGTDAPYVVFVPGATPHVNDLAGNEITMDANEPLTEYSVQWTIRHEFGHVLGFKDCYVEFYDSKNEVIINYQLDINNLMCSRRGKFQETHYSELKKTYYKNFSKKL